MRRLAISLSVLIVVLFGLLAARPVVHTIAQTGTPEAAAGHLIIGAWEAEIDGSPSLFIFHDDGTYVQTDPDGSGGVGVWEATGPNTAALTAHFQVQDESGADVGTAKVRATIEVDESGDSFTAEYTFDFIGPDGASSGEMGPGAATGERIVVEEMGTPVAPMMGEAEGTPTP